jgi:PTH1 family peptidyl-tRNA hydrolase
MKLIVGLGNPGPKYDQTRHNVGFVVIDSLARRYAPGAVARGKFQGAVVEAMIDGEKVFLLKPTTYMNRSGMAVNEAMTFYKLDAAEDLLVIVDDIALPCGAMRVRTEGGAGGHNGLADLIRHLGGERWTRLRIGVDPPGRVPQADYVLGRFRPDQLELVEPILDEAVEAAVCWVGRGAEETMNRFNRKNVPNTTTGPDNARAIER